MSDRSYPARPILAVSTAVIRGDRVLLSLTQSICMVPLMAAVSGWFRRRLGLATGILWAAGGLGAAGHTHQAKALVTIRSHRATVDRCSGIFCADSSGTPQRGSA